MEEHSQKGIFQAIKLIDRLTITVGKAVSWFSLVLILIIVVDVFLRYVLSTTTPATFELEWHLFAAIFLLGAAHTLQQDRHVRVDLFYQRFSERQKAWVNLIGTIFLLLPFCLVVGYESISFVQKSFAVNETSPDPGGLPARYIIKSAIPIGLFLLALQGVSQLLKSVKTLLND